MQKDNIIYCDFQRTKRRQRLDEISNILQKVLIDREYELSAEETSKLQVECSTLVEDELFWSRCKYWK